MTDPDGPSGKAEDGDTDSQDGADTRSGFDALIGRFLPWTQPRNEAEQEDEEAANGQSSVAAFLPGLNNLKRMRVEDVAIPKSEIIAVPVDTGLEELVAVFRDSGFTRLPVFDGTLDMPLGMAHLKDVALEFGFNGGGAGFELRPLVRPLLFAPPSMPLGVLLQKMQSQRMHMALVIDEYGGTDGLLTIEDLIEQVIGEIEDEHDVDEAQPWTREAGGTYLALARAPLEEFEAQIGRSLTEDDTEEEVETLGGLVFLLTGRVPARGEIVRHPDGHEIEVVDAEPRRIKRLRFRPAKPRSGAA